MFQMTRCIWVADVRNRLSKRYDRQCAAWAGETEVTEVMVSTDGGQTWAQAEFVDPVQPYAWRRWKFDWVTPKKPGPYTLLSRAKDTNGDVQPEKHDENYATYVINPDFRLR